MHSGIQFKSDIVGFTVAVAAAGVVSGTMTELPGGQFSEGMIPGMIGAAVGYGIGKKLDESSGEKNVVLDYKKKGLSLDIKEGLI